MEKNYKGNSYTGNFSTIKATTMFPMGILLFQVSQPIRSGNDMLIRFDTINCFWGKLGERYSFKKKSDSKHEKSILMEPSVN